ncbi:hypothetical protein GE21DRAFT_1290427 [Neurospora crassa]|nr:hypothetical protein GE21DRAFT_1290427 [Neurospora crassa]
MDGAYTPTSLLPNPPFFLTKTYRILPPPGACASLVTPRFRKRRRRRRRLWGCTNRRIEQENPTMVRQATAQEKEKTRNKRKKIKDKKKKKNTEGK